MRHSIVIVALALLPLAACSRQPGAADGRLLIEPERRGLDLELNRRIREEILALQARLRFTLVNVTHDREEAFQLATRVVLMDHGRVVRDGTPEEVAEAVRGRFRRADQWDAEARRAAPSISTGPDVEGRQDP